jgi:hypothetical protein
MRQCGDCQLCCRLLPVADVRPAFGEVGAPSRRSDARQFTANTKVITKTVQAVAAVAR